MLHTYNVQPLLYIYTTNQHQSHTHKTAPTPTHQHILHTHQHILHTSSLACTSLTSALNPGTDLRNAASADRAMRALGLLRTASAGGGVHAPTLAERVRVADSSAAATRCCMVGNMVGPVVGPSVWCIARGVATCLVCLLQCVCAGV